MVTKAKSSRGRPRKQQNDFETCLIPGCDLPAATRGMCGKCYQAAKRNISQDNTTWEELIEAGLALPAPSTHSGMLMSAIEQFREENSKSPRRKR